MLIEIPGFTVLAEGSRTQGAVSFFSQTLVLGIIEGDVVQQSNEPIRIAKTGWIQGSISARGPVIISGCVEGTVFSSDRIELTSTAIVTGTLVSPKIEIHAGASVESEFMMRYSEANPNLIERAA